MLRPNESQVNELGVTNHKMNKRNISLITIFAFLFLFQNCQKPTPTEEIKTSVFAGDEKAVEEAEAMFKALGGKEVWAKLKSLYIKALHNEPNLEHPYVSQIWRDLDDFKMRIEQRGPEFDNIGLFSNEAVEIQYLHRDSMRWLSEEALKNAKYSHHHNVYVIFKKLAAEFDISVKFGPENRLDFYQNDGWLCGFGLDEKNRPYRFFSPNPDGTNNESLFKIWNTVEGLTHPAGGGPTDGNFEYKTEIWQPSNQNIEEAFGVAYQPKNFEISDLDWLVGKWKRERTQSPIFEEWTKTDSGFVGKSYVNIENEPKITETLEINQQNGETFYIPMVLNQNEGKPVPFKMLGKFEDRFIFLNPKHDFPQKIVYRKIGTDSVKVSIAGPSGDSWRVIDFDFGKVE